MHFPGWIKKVASVTVSVGLPMVSSVILPPLGGIVGGAVGTYLANGIDGKGWNPLNEKADILMGGAFGAFGGMGGGKILGEKLAGVGMKRLIGKEGERLAAEDAEKLAARDFTKEAEQKLGSKSWRESQKAYDKRVAKEAGDIEKTATKDAATARTAAAKKFAEEQTGKGVSWKQLRTQLKNRTNMYFKTGTRVGAGAGGYAAYQMGGSDNSVASTATIPTRNAAPDLTSAPAWAKVSA